MLQNIEFTNAFRIPTVITKIHSQYKQALRFIFPYSFIATDVNGIPTNKPNYRRLRRSRTGVIRTWG